MLIYRCSKNSYLSNDGQIAISFWGNIVLFVAKTYVEFFCGQVGGGAKKMQRCAETVL